MITDSFSFFFNTLVLTLKFYKPNIIYIQFFLPDFVNCITWIIYAIYYVLFFLFQSIFLVLCFMGGWTKLLFLSFFFFLKQDGSPRFLPYRSTTFLWPLAFFYNLFFLDLERKNSFWMSLTLFILSIIILILVLYLNVVSKNSISNSLIG